MMLEKLSDVRLPSSFSPLSGFIPWNFRNLTLYDDNTRSRNFRPCVLYVPMRINNVSTFGEHVKQSASVLINQLVELLQKMDHTKKPSTLPIHLTSEAGERSCFSMF